jgi:hypothetical protein
MLDRMALSGEPSIMPPATRVMSEKMLDHTASSGDLSIIP